MAPSYKLTYFDIRGLAEPIRILFKYGEIDFEDVRIAHEEWPKLKEATPFGVLPVLEFNGRRVGESTAIARFAGNLAKLGGKDDWENLEIDAVVDSFNDLGAKLKVALWERDETKKKALIATAHKETIPYYFRRFDALIQKNKGYLALGRLTWADLYVISLAPAFDAVIDSKLFNSYPNLKALREKVEALPAVKKWIEERPKTER